MKKILLLLVVLFTVLSCKDDESSMKGARKVYFTEYSARRVGVIDLKKLKQFETLTDNANDGLNNPAFVTIDEENGNLYVAEEVGNRIVKIDIATGDLDVVYDVADGVNKPTSMAIDIENELIYFANSGTDEIMRGSFDGSTELFPLFDGASVADYSYGLSIDVTAGKIYFADFGTDFQISVGNLNGTGTPTVIFPEGTPKLGCPSNIVVDGSKLYWADECGGNIVVANADGTGTPGLLFGLDDGVTSADALVIDKEAKKIYWSENDKNIISRGNLDGTGEKDVILEDINSYSIALGFKK